MHYAYAYRVLSQSMYQSQKFCETQYFESVQIINQQPYNRLLRPTNIFSFCRFGVWAGKIFVWGAPPLLAHPPLVAALLNRLKTLSAKVNAAQRATRILLKRGETKVFLFFFLLKNCVIYSLC